MLLSHQLFRETVPLICDRPQKKIHSQKPEQKDNKFKCTRTNITQNILYIIKILRSFCGVWTATDTDFILTWAVRCLIDARAAAWETAAEKISYGPHTTTIVKWKLM
jgi:hypothetical protein